MKTCQRYFTLVSGLLVVTCLSSQPAAEADTSYHLLKEIPIRGGGKWTALAVDETGRRLYAAHGDRIEVINLNNNAPLGAITDTRDVQGFVVAPSVHMGLASSGSSRSVSLLDLNNLRTTARMKTGAGPAAVVFEPSKLQLYSFNESDHSATIGEADDGDFLATIDLGGKPSSATTDANASFESKNGRVYASIEDKDEVIAIDVATHNISDRWPVAPGHAPGSLVIDGARHRLYAACNNKLLVAMDSVSGKVISTAPIGDGTGEVVCDLGAKNVFCSTTDGMVSIFHDDGDKLSLQQTIKTKPGAGVLGLDNKTHQLFIGSADYCGATVSSGALTILVYVIP